MNTSSREEFPAKQEGTDAVRISKEPSTSKTWLGLKDPRIVRVSRSFGGKDRHSKVFTVRGLRDRRVRLSIQTAIQLYDLQDRLGFNQPSKAVDWLLNASQHKIDSLPPLQMPQENIIQYQPFAVSHELDSPQAPSTRHPPGKHENVSSLGSHSLALLVNQGKGIDSEAREDQTTLPRSSNWHPEDHQNRRNEHENQEAVAVNGTQMFPCNSPPKPNYPSFPCFLNTSMPSNVSASHLTGHGYPFQTEETYNYSILPIPPSLSPSSGSQLVLYPSETTPSFFPSYVGSIDYDPKQMNHIQMLSSTSQNLSPNSVAASLYSITPTMRPFQVNIASKYLSPQKNNQGQ